MAKRDAFELTTADRLLLIELLAVAQMHILEIAAQAEARKLVNVKLPSRLRGWASSCADFIARLQAGV